VTPGGSYTTHVPRGREAAVAYTEQATQKRGAAL